MSARRGGMALEGPRWLAASAAALAVGLGARVMWLSTTPAQAEMVTSRGEYVAMTTEGNSEELLTVVDNREEVLLVYRVANQKSVELAARHSLPELFQAARGQAGR